MRVENQPGTVVAGEDDQGLLGQTPFTKRVEHATDRFVEFFDHVAEDPARTPAATLVRREKRHVRKVMGDVKKEGLFPMFVDETDRLLRVTLGDRRLIGRPLDDRGQSGRPAGRRPEEARRIRWNIPIAKPRPAPTSVATGDEPHRRSIR